MSTNLKKIALGKNKINARTARIRQLNDELRIRTRLPKRKDRRRWLVGSGAEKIGNIVAAASAFDDWNEGDNPYGEHDFGKLDVDGGPSFSKLTITASTSCTVPNIQTIPASLSAS
ncbi:DUF3768 domain-containing protein [Sinorhizobium meliloti]|nr:DUF3768 domain-containing protein [Sinorhizobium meliloti]